MTRTLVFTGGGTAGHVTPNLALIKVVRERGWEVYYIGSAKGIEREMVIASGINFRTVACGKLRRYFSWLNFVDPIRSMIGVVQAFFILRNLRPDLVFSKGGFVAVPVVVAAWLSRIPVLSHESDVTPGLANRLCYPVCRRIFVTFESTLKYFDSDKALLTGTPVRPQILNGDAAQGLNYLGFHDCKPVLMVFGGSVGASAINDSIRRVLPELLCRFQVIHIVGKDNIDESIIHPDYRQKEFISNEFGDVLAAASLVVSRAGANSLYELLVTRTPHLLIPLTNKASRGDQLVNANVLEEGGFSQVLHENSLNDQNLLTAVFKLEKHADEISEKLASFPIKNSIDLIMREIEQAVL